MNGLLAAWHRLGYTANGWSTLGLLVVPALVTAAFAVPARALGGHLPAPGPDSPYWPVASVGDFWAGCWLLIWLIGLFVFGLLPRNQREGLWELGVPSAYAAAGFFVCLFAVAMVQNLNAPARVDPADWGWRLGLVAVLGACALGGLGAFIGRRATAGAFDPVRVPGRVRAAWLTTTWAGLGHWLWSLLGGVLVTVLLVATNQLSPDVAIVVAAALTAIALSFGVARVSVTPAGVRVRLGPYGMVSWRHRIDEIVSVEVTRLARVPLRPSISWQNVRFRGGPALLLRTRFGTVHVIAMERAAAAAAVLQGWLSQPVAPPAAATLPLSFGKEP
jgi:hypothetical protein